MERRDELALIERALAQLRSRQPEGAGDPTERAVDGYTGPERLAAERRTVFAKSPILVGFASQVAEPRSWLAHDQGPTPIVVTRDRAGTLRAFVNACRHRGTRLVDGQGRDCARLVCPYHGWAYALDGRLAGLPHRRSFGELDTAERALVELPVHQRFGLVWVVPSPVALGAFDFDAFFGPLLRDLDGWGFETHVPLRTRSERRRANWKLIVDGSFEAYHFRVAHADTIADVFMDNLGLFDHAGPHSRLVATRRSMATQADVAPAERQLRPHANLIYGVFPNTILLVQSDHVIVTSVWPLAPDESVMSSTLLVPEPPTTDKARRYWQRNEDIFWAAISEDLDMGERIQSTLASGANATLLFGRFEYLLAAFESAVDREVERG